MSMTPAARGGQSPPKIPKILPHEKVFPIQIGSELFRLSGASISSDAPSYFSQFFGRQLQENQDDCTGIKTLYIDRDPDTFKDISKHLQGYHITPRDGSHYVKLFADAQFYSLPRLVSQLFDSEIFIQIGHRHFQIPRNIFNSPGDTPNYFSLGFAVFFATPSQVFPGLPREGLLRPPSIIPPMVPNRSAKVFGELLHMLRGYPLHIRNEEHRAELLRDCRYFQFKGLEQKLIPHRISFNVKRDRKEILIRLEDLRPSGVSFVYDAAPADGSSTAGWVNYARPFVDESATELVLETAGESTSINLQTRRAEFYVQTKARIASLFQIVANKMKLEADKALRLSSTARHLADQAAKPIDDGFSENYVKVKIADDASVVLDGEIFLPERLRPSLPEGVTFNRRSISLQSSTTDAGLSVPRPKDDFSSMDSSEIAPGRTASVPSPSLSRDPHPSPSGQPSEDGEPPRKRKRGSDDDTSGEWIVRKGQWRLRVQPRADSRKGGLEVVLVAVKLEAFTGEKIRNASRPFLG